MVKPTIKIILNEDDLRYHPYFNKDTAICCAYMMSTYSNLAYFDVFRLGTHWPKKDRSILLIRNQKGQNRYYIYHQSTQRFSWYP